MYRQSFFSFYFQGLSTGSAVENQILIDDKADENCHLATAFSERDWTCQITEKFSS